MCTVEGRECVQAVIQSSGLETSLKWDLQSRAYLLSYMTAFGLEKNITNVTGMKTVQKGS